MGSIIRPNDPTGYRGTSPQARYAQTPALASDQLSPRTFSTNGYSQSSESYTAIRRRYLAQLMGSRHRSVGPPSPPSSGSLASTFSSGSRMVRRPESFDSHHTHNNISGMYHRSAASTPGGINPRALSMASSPCPIFTNGDTSLAGSSHLSIAGAYHGPEEFQEGKEEEHPAYVSSIGAEITIAQPTPKQPVGVRQSGLPRGLTEADTEYGRGGSLTSERHWDSGRTVKVESVTPSVLDTDVEFERDSQGLAPSRKSEQRARKSCHREATSEDEASYFCKICDRGFARRYNYISHLSTHDQHRPRPWTCTRQDCSKSFRRATDLKRHEHSVHLKSKAWVCELCHAGFPRKDSLQRHEAQGCSMRGALKRRLARTRNTLSQEVQVGPDFERNGGSLKQERTSTPEAETSSNVERPVSSYDMSVKTDGLETPSLFSPLLRDLEPRETGQLWSRPVTSGAYAFGQQEVAWNGYMPASYYTSSLDIQF